MNSPRCSAKNSVALLNIPSKVTFVINSKFSLMSYTFQYEATPPKYQIWKINHRKCARAHAARGTGAC